ncbi:MAG: thioredoxin domain-containing protein, partial [Deltaproteobacteria bacterium]|nr:thioredoxin domain-containing protein [Deltaproteobacteria bacterium]
MVLCIIAFVVAAVMSVFSAKYRPLARDGFQCVLRTVTFRPCDTTLEQRIKAEVVSSVLGYSPWVAKTINAHFTFFSWFFLLLTVASLAYSAYGIYNFYLYGNCDGPKAIGACILNDITGDYGRFSEPKDLIPPTEMDGITDGNRSAKVTIVEFGCFTCPYTKQAESTMEKLLAEYNGSIYYVFKPFPLPNHENSREAAKAVLCARNQGKHWELQEEIFAHQGECSVDGTLEIKDLAASAGLDMAAFSQCYDNNETVAELDRYIQQGKDAHIYATPTFFINGKPIVGPKP